MTDGMRGHSGVALPEGLSRLGAMRQHLVFWDLSAAPADNSNRPDKIGKGETDTTRGIALNGFSRSTLRAQFADGFKGEPYVSTRNLEPDNFILRLHNPLGQGRDNVWALRLIADHQHKHGEREHRSTMVIDQCTTQNWAWSADLMRVLRRRSDLTHEELHLTAAGFLPGVYDPTRAVAGIPKRGTLAMNVSRQAGFFSDGKSVAQYHHFFSHYRATPISSGVCGEAFDHTLALRGDALVHAESDLAVLTYHDQTRRDDGRGYPFFGTFHRCFETGSYRKGQEFGNNAGLGTAYDPYPTETIKDDALSNHSRIIRADPTKGLQIHVHEWSGANCFPRALMSELSASEVPTPAADGGAKKLPTITKERGHTKAVFPQGQITSMHEVKAMPHHYGDIGLVVVIPYTLSALLTGVQTMTFELNFRKTPNPGDTIPSAWTASATVTLAVADNPATVNVLRWIMLVINTLGVNAAGIAGGEVSLWFQRRSDDTATADFEINGGITAYFIPANEGVPGDSNVKLVTVV